MAELAYVPRALGLAGAVQAVSAPLPYQAVRGLALASGIGRHWGFAVDNAGTITNNNRVMVKPEPSAPEVPYAGARVRLHRITDGYCAWEGVSDAGGFYWPRGLEVGVAYYPVAIDLAGTHECDAAGPVIAVKAP